jgi:hypothetical protein
MMFDHFSREVFHRQAWLQCERANSHDSSAWCSCIRIVGAAANLQVRATCLR